MKTLAQYLMLSEPFAFRHVLHSIYITRIIAFKRGIACKKQSVCCEQKRQTSKNYAVIYILVPCMHVNTRHCVNLEKADLEPAGKSTSRPSTWHWG